MNISKGCGPLKSVVFSFFCSGPNSVGNMFCCHQSPTAVTKCSVALGWSIGYNGTVTRRIKALLLFRWVVFPFVHDLAEFVTVLQQSGQQVPASIAEAARLTRFAVTQSPSTHRVRAW